MARHRFYLGGRETVHCQMLWSKTVPSALAKHGFAFGKTLVKTQVWLSCKTTKVLAAGRHKGNEAGKKSIRFSQEEKLWNSDESYGV